eukprot:TRINITY_DN73628_c0_g1_i1.p1 TRINITY_DN73628_c0_g1~~TRINITY_DN73628_c0_g1_i1.p1  ORF type:complete len:407 (-),score=51.46 TRINITY_DN73628_c0_g1_i1:158-1336(-)
MATQNRYFVAFLIVCVAVTGTANNFASRIKAEILGNYNFVCVVPDSIIQLTFNVLVLVFLTRRKKVHPSQFDYVFRCGRTWAQTGAWKYLTLAGVNDVINNVTGLAAQPYLSTFMMSLMDQATTPFTVFFSVLLLRTRYISLEIVSVVVILVAAISCVLIAHGNNVGDSDEFWALFAAATTSFAALSYVLKEITFNSYLQERKASIASQQSALIQVQMQSLGSNHPSQGDVDAECASHENGSAGLDPLNVFLVGSIINAVGLISSVPIALINYAAVSSGSPWAALQDGLRFLFEKDGALTAYLIYVAINTAFNVSLILCTSYGSALLSFLSLKTAVPLTAILSAVPWPVIGAQPLHSSEWYALFVLVIGISAFRYGNVRRLKQEELRRSSNP